MNSGRSISVIVCVVSTVLAGCTSSAYTKPTSSPAILNPTLVSPTPATMDSVSTPVPTPTLSLEEREELLRFFLESLVENPNYDLSYDVLHLHVHTVQIDVTRNTVTFILGHWPETADEFIQAGASLIKATSLLVRSQGWTTYMVEVVVSYPLGGTISLYVTGRRTLGDIADGEVSVWDVMETEDNRAVGADSVPASTPGPPPTSKPSGGSGGTLAALSLRNRSYETICYVRISPVSDSTWGEDQLGRTETIPPGGIRLWRVSPGAYDLRAEDCTATEIDVERNVIIIGTYIWNVGGVSAPPTCTCSYNAYDCADFPTHAAAQACYNHCLRIVGYDVHWLDGDDDGSACESLP